MTGNGASDRDRRHHRRAERKCSEVSTLSHAERERERRGGTNGSEQST